MSDPMRDFVQDSVRAMLIMFREAPDESYKTAVRDCIHACDYTVLMCENGEAVAVPLSSILTSYAKDREAK
jgi:hypothetical protein